MIEDQGSGGIAPGTRLSEARRMQNLATADVARRLKLSVGQVEALEAGRFQDLPGPIFVRGFIRNYAKLVKLDPDELLQAAGDSLPQSTQRPELPPSQNIPFPGKTPRSWPRFAVAIVGVVALLAVYEFRYNEPPESVATRPAADEPAAPPAKARKAVKSAKSKAPAEATAPIARHATAAPAAASPPTAATAVTYQERPAGAEEREVRFVFDEESWVEVRDRNDRVILYQLHASGTARRVFGLPPLSVVVGNAHGVRMTYEGEPVDLARHTKIDVARLTLE
jgi:cytoskeleton protein RodZ